MKRFLLFLFCMMLSKSLAAEEPGTPLAVLFTGSSNGMIKPCHCPGQPLGGLARRKTLVDSLRRGEPNSIFVDTGNWLSSYNRRDEDALAAEPGQWHIGPPVALGVDHHGLGRHVDRSQQRHDPVGLPQGEG